MFKELSLLEPNLRRAGYILLIEILGGTLLALVLSQVNLEALAIMFVWIINLSAAWFLARAAKLQGCNAWLTGFISIIPLMALLQFFLLCGDAPRSKQAS
jgi:ABC-type proline/glycine betaine transport system permease subunit